MRDSQTLKGSVVIGVDIGGTNIDIGVVDKSFTVHSHTRFKTDKTSPQKMLGDICSSVSRLLKHLDETGVSCEYIGVGSPGRTSDNRTIIRAGNIPYKNTPVAEIIENFTNKEVYLDNDASCALYAEKHAGAGKNVSDMIVMTIGTGIGGGIMINRKSYHGHNNRAGEIGHFIMDKNGPPCPCGLYGCFEKYASVTAFVEAARKEAEARPESLLFELAGGNPENIGGRTPFKAMYAGCEVSKGIIEKYIKNLAGGINSLNKIFQPQIFVLTGGLTNEGEIITSMLKPHLLPEVTAVLSPLGGKAGIVGASLIKKEREE